MIYVSKPPTVQSSSYLLSMRTCRQRGLTPLAPCFHPFAHCLPRIIIKSPQVIYQSPIQEATNRICWPSICVIPWAKCEPGEKKRPLLSLPESNDRVRRLGTCDASRICRYRYWAWKSTLWHMPFSYPASSWNVTFSQMALTLLHPGCTRGLTTAYNTYWLKFDL